MHSVIMVTVWGDIFFEDNNKAIFWLQTDEGNLSKVADSNQDFQLFLKDENKIDNWFLPLLLEKLYNAGKILKEDEVFGFLKMPVLGGEYSIEKIVPCSMSVHFTFTGEICEQIKDLPDGTKVNVKFRK
ncbi:MAG TPA: T6SS immunity protein Tdi1 domain-containing protein [Puia sp.]|nr:T6SS immunity protein Tdi1 domain-containing protein [Puia sp.]